ncbi:MAG: RluA family pseudouridine synthase [Clostridiales bacterium]|nr:RluA family pseudouridine synthase [Clostridiales bacterium]
MLQVLYEDAHVIVVWKPVGLESQASRGFEADMVSEIHRHIHKLSTQPGRPYVGVIHRLDKPVSGAMVYAKDEKSAAALSRQVSGHEMEKKYLAVLCGKPVDNVNNFVDYLLKNGKINRSDIVDKGTAGAKRAELSFRVVDCLVQEPWGTLTLADVTLMTGRHHQIRVQMAGHGLPIWGDNRYNPMFAEGKRQNPPSAGPVADRSFRVSGQTGRADIALSAYHLAFTHPVTGKRMTFERMPEAEIFHRFPAVP